jgi:hypothetical protein
MLEFSCFYMEETNLTHSDIPNTLCCKTNKQIIVKPKVSCSPATAQYKTFLQT